MCFSTSPAYILLIVDDESFGEKIKEIGHICEWFVGRNIIYAQIWVNFLYGFVTLHS